VACISLRPTNPDRICWGCDKYCPADDLACGTDTIRTPHPIELFGEDWLEWVEKKEKEGTGQNWLTIDGS
jgi:Protein of unknown function (DUF3079)